MNDVTKSKYNLCLKEPGRGNNQKAHQLRRSAFSAFVFQIIGNKHVVLAAIQYPISSAAQPEYAVKRFMSAWQQEKLSEDYKKRKQISEELTNERRALKNAAHAARQALVRGKIEKKTKKQRQKNSCEAQNFTRRSTEAPGVRIR